MLASAETARLSLFCDVVPSREPTNSKKDRRDDSEAQSRRCSMLKERMPPMKAIALWIMSGLAVAPFAFAKPQVFTNTNPVTGETSVAVRNNFIPCKGPFFAQIQLAPMKLPVQGSEPQYVISVVFGGIKWLFIQGPLVANIDGSVVSFKQGPIPPTRTVESGAVVFEMVAFFVDRSDIDKIAHASKVLVQVGGSNGVFFLTLKPENIAAFREFLAKSK